MSGYVYVMSNPSMPGLVKVGRTGRTAATRADELHSTGVPTPFKVEATYWCSNPSLVENTAQRILNRSRVNPGREFFRCSVAEARRAVEAGGGRRAQRKTRTQVERKGTYTKRRVSAPAPSTATGGQALWAVLTVIAQALWVVLKIVAMATVALATFCLSVFVALTQSQAQRDRQRRTRTGW